MSSSHSPPGIPEYYSEEEYINYSSYFHADDEYFDSLDGALAWAKSFALILGFQLITGSSRSGGSQKLLICSRGLKPRSKNTGEEDGERESSTKYCGCRFKINVRCYGTSGWYIDAPEEYGVHNHEMAVYAEGVRQMSRMGLQVQDIVSKMSDAQVKPAQILAAIRRQRPDQNITIKQIYNARVTQRRNSFEGRTIIEHFYHMAREEKYTYLHLVNENSRALSHLFLANPASLNLLRTYPWYLGMDSTYKTNRYKMPLFEIIGMTPTNQNFVAAYAFLEDETMSSYRWVMMCLRQLLGPNVSPKAITTDREAGLVQPIAEYFPNSAHLLCTWHINKDVENKVYHLTGKNDRAAKKFKCGI